ncbi:MAG: hypothetical protein E7397_01420 [Ruminococcaceae bacterium]|nr:hypothetical protein [Oscillospiraceae bacterium]
MKTKRIIGILLTLTMIIGLLPITASATEQDYSVDIASGDITLAETDGVKYVNGTAYEGELTVTDSDTTIANMLTIESGEHNVTIDSVTAKQIKVATGAKLNLTLTGESTVTPSDDDLAAIHVPEGAELVITESSQGSVSATGGSKAAGIGGARSESNGKITIGGGTVTANSARGASIGGGQRGNGTNITISGGTVTAICGGDAAGYGAGIGGGEYGDGTNITISGGMVTAESKHYGAGIGGGDRGDGTDITITGGTIVATGFHGAGIGGGDYYGNGNNIIISGGTVTAVSEVYGAGIGGSDGGAGTNITISGGTITATGGYMSSYSIGGGSSENIFISPEEFCAITVKENVDAADIINKYTEKTNLGKDVLMNLSLYIYTSTCGGNHIDEDSDHKCDICGAYIDELHTDEDDNHLCDVCDYVITECDFDENNGFCMVCGALDVPELKDNYYQIENAGNLYWFANHINTVDRTANAVLLNDIDLEGKPDGTGRKWTPIGSTGEHSNNFRGHFDGRNHTITNLYIDETRAGIGLFGEVRLGTVENFTIYGDVKLYGDCSYVGGVIGSAPGANGTDVPGHNGATIRNITSYVDVTLVENAHGSSFVGGFMGYANHKTIIENCSWYGTLDLGANRADSGVGGLVGRLYDGSDVSIRNCAAYGTIKTSYKSGTYDNYDTIYIGGVVSFSPAGTKTVLENNLWAGTIENKTDLGEKAHLSAFGTLNGEESVINCYALGSTPYITTGNQYTDDITTVTAQQLASGEVAYQLGDAFGQRLGTDAFPIPGGQRVYYGYYSCADEAPSYSNSELTSISPIEHNLECEYNNTEHTVVCSGCGMTVTGEHSYDETTLQCICGKFNPDTGAAAVLTKNGTLVSTYSTLEEAIEAVKTATEADHAVVTLLKSLRPEGGNLKIESGVFTLDLGGYEIRSAVHSLGLVYITGSETKVTVTDSGTDGRIAFYDHDSNHSYDYGYGTTTEIEDAYGILVDGADVTVHGGIVEAYATSNDLFTNCRLYCLYAMNHANITITGGRMESLNISAYNTVYGVYATDSNVTISGGSIAFKPTGIGNYPLYGMYAVNSNVTISDVKMKVQTTSWNSHGMYVVNSDVTVSGGELDIYGTEIYSENSDITLTVAEGNKKGMYSANGFSVEGTTLAKILGDGVAYCQFDEEVALTEDQNTIMEGMFGGNPVTVERCTHSLAEYVCDDTQHTLACPACSYAKTDIHADENGDSICDSCQRYSGTEFAISAFDKEINTATVLIPTEGTYTAVFADYEGGRLANLQLVPVTVAFAKAEQVTAAMNHDLSAGDKIMLWQDKTDIVPMCGAYIVE